MSDHVNPEDPHDDLIRTRRQCDEIVQSQSQGVLGYLIAFVVIMSLAAIMAHVAGVGR